MIFSIELQAELVLWPKFALEEMHTRERFDETVDITEDAIVANTGDGDVTSTMIGTTIAKGIARSWLLDAGCW
jgi:hypothetical protein